VERVPPPVVRPAEVVAAVLRQPVLFDGRNMWNPAELRGAGFTYYAIGRGKAA
jgi:UDPglucose 6-dehydrogenase